MFMLRRVGPAITAGGVLAWKCHSHYEVRNICEDAPKRRNIAFATCEISANAPREDRAVHTDGLQGAGAFFLVLDGHGGWQVAEFAQNNLIPLVAEELNGNVSSSLNNDKVVAEALVRGFERCDEAYASRVKHAFELGFGQTARVGACALLAYVDIVEDALHVACAGDCQAILGTDRGDAVQMSEEHNARVTKEAARIFREHPNEPDAVRCKPNRPDACYVKGRLQPTRCLGDLYLKDANYNGPPYAVFGRFVDRTRGRHVPHPYTPPYITATPTVVSRRLEDQDRFLILATDGLWDHMTGEEAVAITSQVFDEQRKADVEAAESSTEDEQAVSYATVNSEMDREIRAACCRSAAEALIRKALQRAAAHRGVGVQDLLAMPLGKNRRGHHDDITVTVVSLSEWGTSRDASKGFFGSLF